MLRYWVLRSVDTTLRIGTMTIDCVCLCYSCQVDWIDEVMIAPVGEVSWDWVENFCEL